TILRSAGPPALALTLMGFFAYHAVMGPNGVLALKDVKQQVVARTGEYAVLEKQRAVLQNPVDRLDPNKAAHPDLVEHLLRRQLNVVRADEVIVLDAKK